MAVFQVQVPDGRVLDIEAADEATAMRGAREWFATNAQPSPTPAPSVAEPSASEKLGRELGLTARAVGPTAAGAALGAALGAPFAGVGAIPGAAIGAGIGTLAGPLSDVGVNLFNYMTGKNVATPSEAQGRTMTAMGLPEPATSGERIRGAVARGIVEAGAGATGATAASRLLPEVSQVARPVLQTMGAAPTAQMAGGAAGGATGQTLTEAGFGPLASLGGSIVGGALGSRAVTPFPANLNPQQQRFLQVAKERNIPLTPAEATGSSLLRDVETRLPMMSRSSQQEALNREVASSFGGNALTRDAFNIASSRIGNVFDQVLGDTKLVIDTGSGFKQRIQTIAGVMESELGADLPPKFAARVRDLLALPDNTLGPRLQTERTKLVKAESAVTDPAKKEAITALREQIDDVIERSLTPENATDWRTARTEWRNLQTVMDAMGTSPEAFQGNINTQRLANELQRRYGESRFQRGMTDQTLQDVADVGQGLIQRQTELPIAERALTGLTLSGAGGTLGYQLGGPAGAAFGAIATPLAASAAYNNPLVRSYLQNQLLAGKTEPAFLGFSQGVLGINNEGGQR